MTTAASGPDALSWFAAMLRGLHPIRWLLSLAALATTVLIVAAAQWLFTGQTPRLADWFNEPATQGQELAQHLAGRSRVGILIRVGALVSVVSGVWSLTGCWIARHELIARHRGQPYGVEPAIEPGSTALVFSQFKALLVSLPIILIFCAILMVPFGIALFLNWLGGLGGILVALLLPVLLIANLLLFCLAFGIVAWPLMPVTLAAENHDIFDALSRAYNYAFMLPVRFIVLMAISAALAVLPVAAVLYTIAGAINNWLDAAGRPAVWVAAGLSMSMFWSLMAMAYLDLRTVIDGTDADELAGVAESSKAQVDPTIPKETTTNPKKSKPIGVLGHVLIFLFVVATWFATAWLFARFGGENAKWLTWGMGEKFVPPAVGLYFIASAIALVWGVAWLLMPIVVPLRRALRPSQAMNETRSDALPSKEPGGESG